MQNTAQLCTFPSPTSPSFSISFVLHFATLAEPYSFQPVSRVTYCYIDRFGSGQNQRLSHCTPGVKVSPSATCTTSRNSFKSVDAFSPVNDTAATRWLSTYICFRDSAYKRRFVASFVTRREIYMGFAYLTMAQPGLVFHFSSLRVRESVSPMYGKMKLGCFMAQCRIDSFRAALEAS
ncbi:hypothetical protein K505DRAFT_67125 [Melanomma pulvis-pyrius CBS 109.77]|uniref:Uncharacterized protein n=1 Tax=Melanomma pulvis-pyrius CBS 109.77 TaxID=1314802 RepID=A0A6A6X4W5_9PLEO|nr:hypothetical protein K505DRAFT_67125 [Melanomma pulvis-pyrius CBS 109.77]